MVVHESGGSAPDTEFALVANNEVSKSREAWLARAPRPTISE
jgi:hypothetical protein